ncbi:MAG TPA: AMP-binding protein [Pseudonocardia sp.]|nr:AMP-binding protein [Pseudonocardia sp.]
MSERRRCSTLLDYVERNSEEHPGVVALVDGDNLVTWSHYLRTARAIGSALLELGVGRGDVVALHMVNRAEHVLSDIGVLFAGATPTSYYNTLAEEQLAFVAEDSAAAVAIIDRAQLPLWLAIKDRLPALRQLVVLDLDPDRPLPAGAVPFEDWVEAAAARVEAQEERLAEVRSQITPSDPLTIVYTSGTTGPPKGTVITHAAAVSLLDEIERQLVEHRGGPVPVGWSTVSYLPLAHIAERLFSHYQSLARVVTCTYIRAPSELPHVLPTTRPYLFLGMPRVWERMHGAIRERIVTSKNPVRRRIGAAALATAVRVGAARFSDEPVRARTRFVHRVMERLVYSKIRATLGLDRVELPVSGAAQLAPEIMTFFAGIGIKIIEVYGMTETCGMLTASPLHAPRPGTVGCALQGIELKIAPDGEVLAKGINITPGYLNRAEATAEAVDASGWLHTGDLGQLDDAGYLTITGRKKELINTDSGKTIAPGTVENALGSGSDLIGSVYVHGDRKPCLVALVTLDPTGWRDWCEGRDIAVGSLSDAVSDGRVRLEVARSIGAGNTRLSRAEQVKNWALLDAEWTSASGELTPTMKLRRPVIAERYRDEIEQLYDPLTSDSWSGE